MDESEEKAKYNARRMYVELHAASAFSFLRGSSLPEALVARAADLGYPALALVDRDGVSGAPRFFKAAKANGVRPIVGAELSLEGGGALPLLVEDRRGYQALCRLITRMKEGVPKGEGRLRLEWLGDGRPGGLVGGLVALPGLETLGTPPDTDRLARLVAAFGKDRIFIDTQRHRRREQEAAQKELRELAEALGLRAVATNGVRHAEARGRPLQDVLTCIREKTTLAKAGRLLCENAERHLKSPKAMAALFADRKDLLRNAEELAERLTFTLDDLGYRFPDYPVPAGETAHSFLCRMTEAGARERYRPYHEKARLQIERELRLIGKLDLPGYFLIVWDLVNFCRREGILVQGRGSAANSAVCYSLGITAVDPVGMELLFERFLSEERGEWPDIDLDLPSGDRRERVIQYVYERYGARGRGHDRERHHLPRPQRLAGDRQGAGHPAGGDRSPGPLHAPLRVRGPRRHAGEAPGERRGRPAGPAHPGVRPALRGDPGPAPPSRPALGGHGHGPGPPRPRGAPGARHHARAGGRAVGQGRLRRPRHHQGRPAGPRDDVGASGLPPPALRAGGRWTWPISHRTTPRSTRCCRRPTPWASSRWRAAPRWPPCPA